MQQILLIELNLYWIYSSFNRKGRREGKKKRKRTHLRSAHA